jgi:hypothetical protein
MLRKLWEQVRQIFGNGDKVMVEILTRRNGQLVRVPVPVRVDDVERFSRRR